MSLTQAGVDVRGSLSRLLCQRRVIPIGAGKLPSGG